ncbi:tripartite tricarboxylate transporter substrate binding protein [Hydrogenophaga sp.]|uniref:Bug family tripartite tricarboxylate transporter substrate binding protein n=1 Tax=Hydrogenophaga sp. TaxID=1904254 RepID=UPI00271E97AF|nr:tripartite tricarboxylate transporter substrate binding protein [Hydrogenophaga sp.]MDO9436989.1 tripartite tricarboxylate transporter substrate binding protein [Hydrogenophaga sp.]
MRREFLKRAAALSATVVLSPMAFAQADWPTRPITLLVPYPPGGALDPIARALAAQLPALLGQPIVVVNRPGGNTSIASTAVYRAEPDGYTLVINSPTTQVLHTMQAPRGYDAVKGFSPIASVSHGDWVLAVHASVPANNLPELIAYGRANPDKLSAGVTGAGTADHLGTELFKHATDIKFMSVPYKGSGAAMIDLVAGRVQMMISTKTVLQPQIDAGKLRLIAYTSQPVGEPPVPTFAQAGLKGFEVFGTTLIVLGPPNMPAPIVNRLTNAIERAIQMPETKTMLANVNQRPFYEPPAAVRDRLTAANALFTDIIQKTGIKFEE